MMDILNTLQVLAFKKWKSEFKMSTLSTGVHLSALHNHSLPHLLVRKAGFTHLLLLLALLAHAHI